MTLTLIAVFGVFQAILFLMHAVVYKTMALSFGWQWPWLAWMFAVLSITFVSASILTFCFDNAVVRWYYRFSAYWFGLSIFLCVGAMAAYYIEYFFYAAGVYVSPTIVGGICLGGIFLIHTYATWQTRRVKVTRIEVAPVGSSDETSSMPPVAWPAAWRGKKIVFVSDVHLGAIWGAAFSRKVVAAVAAESPEMVLIGGDIFDGVKCHAPSILAPFADLRSPKGTYFVTGNHEYIEDTPMMIKEIEDLGVRILRNESVDVAGIQVAGVDWKDTYKKEEFEKTLAAMKLDPAKPSILMRHEPNHLGVAERAGVSLILCGHTHRGQIFPLNLITRQMYHGFDYGLKRLGGMMVYTSSGVGTWGPPLRLGTKSEIVVIMLR